MPLKCAAIRVPNPPYVSPQDQRRIFFLGRQRLREGRPISHAPGLIATRARAGLPSGRDSLHIGRMAKRSDPSRPAKAGKDPHAIVHTRAKASKPVTKPLDEHLAVLLNPALTADAKRGGFGEAPQARFDATNAPGLDDKLAKALGALPSPLAGEGGFERSEKPGEGWVEVGDTPHPESSLRSAPTLGSSPRACLPTRGEVKGAPVPLSKEAKPSAAPPSRPRPIPSSARLPPCRR